MLVQFNRQIWSTQETDDALNVLFKTFKRQRFLKATQLNANWHGETGTVRPGFKSSHQNKIIELVATCVFFFPSYKYLIL